MSIVHSTKEILLQDVATYERDVLQYVERVAQIGDRARTISFMGQYLDPGTQHLDLATYQNRMTKIDDEIHEWTERGLMLWERRLILGTSIDNFLLGESNETSS
jgi:hypothetical protein